MIERRLPPSEHAEALECLRLSGQKRYYDLFVPSIGMIHYDIAAQWSIVHVCKTVSCTHVPPQMSDHDPTCAREPDQRDIASLHRWLYEFRDFEDSRKGLERERLAQEQKVKQNFTSQISKELKSSPTFRALEFSDAPQAVFKESETP